MAQQMRTAYEFRLVRMNFGSTGSAQNDARRYSC